MRLWPTLPFHVLLLSLGCETASQDDPDALASHLGSDSDVAHSEDEDSADGEGGPDAPDSSGEEPDTYVRGPSSTLETPLTGLDDDALLPELSGDHLVYVSVRPSAETEAARVPGTPELDCLACPGCGGCEWRIHVRTLKSDADADSVIAQETWLQAAPRLADGRVVWLHSDGTIGLYEVATGALRTVTLPYGWPGSAPLPFDGGLWWYGYSNETGQSGLIRLDPDTQKSEMKVVANMYEQWVVPSGNLSGIARWQPFSLTQDGAVWTDWGMNSQVVRSWTPGSAASEVRLEDPTRDYFGVAMLPGGAFVTKSYVRELGCSEQNCEPELQLHSGKDPNAVELTGAGSPSLYGRLIVGGNRVFWLDFRDGPYAIWSRRIDTAETSPPERMTSDDAIVGAMSPTTADADRMVWMDRRDGLWRIYTKSL